MTLTANVVDGQIILASWGNNIRDRTVQQFATKAELDTWAAPDGCTARTLDTGLLWLRQAGAWRTTPSGLVGNTEYTAVSGAVGTTATAVPGFAVSVNHPTASRKIRLSGSVTVFQSGGDSLVRWSIRDGAAVVVPSYTFIPSSRLVTFSYTRIIQPTAGTHTYQGFISTDVGTVQLDGASGPGTMYVEDFG